MTNSRKLDAFHIYEAHPNNPRLKIGPILDTVFARGLTEDEVAQNEAREFPGFAIVARKQRDKGGDSFRVGRVMQDHEGDE